MEIYQLKVFLEVAHHLSFTEAAYTLNLTQPAVTAKIKSLESDLNTPLFYRLGRKIELTEVGKLLANEAINIVELENKIRKKIEEFKEGEFGSINIGTTPAIADPWLSLFLYKYRKEYPGIEARIQTYISCDQIHQALLNQEIDIGFSIIGSQQFNEIIDIQVDTINYYIFVNNTHPLAKKEILSIRELMNHNWVIGSKDFFSRLMLESRLSELGINLTNFKQLEIVDTLGLMKTYLTQDNYLGFASDLEFKNSSLLDLVSIPIQEFAFKGNLFLLASKRYENSINIEFQNKRKHQSTPVEKFISLILNYSKGEGEQTLETQNNLNSAPKLKEPYLNLVKSSSKKQEDMPIRIGIQNSTIPTITAGLIPQKLGLIEHFLPRSKRYSSINYDLQLLDFSMGQPIVEGLHNDDLDIGILGDYPLLQSAKISNSYSPTILVSFVTINPEGTGNAIVVPQRSKIKNIKDLQGEIIELPFGSSAHGMVLRALKDFNLLEDVQLCPMSKSMMETIKSQDKTNSIYAHFSPFHELAHFQGKYQYLPSDNFSSILPSFYGVVVRKEFAENHPDIVVSYLKAIVASQYWYINTPNALSLISEWTKISPKLLNTIISKNYYQEESNLFFPELHIREDWIQSHIEKLKTIPNHEYLEELSLQNWIQQEFIKTALNIN